MTLRKAYILLGINKHVKKSHLSMELRLATISSMDRNRQEPIFNFILLGPGLILTAGTKSYFFTRCTYSTVIAHTFWQPQSRRVFDHRGQITYRDRPCLRRSGKGT